MHYELQAADRVRQAVATDWHEFGALAVAAIARSATMRKDVSPPASAGQLYGGFLLRGSELAVEVDGSVHATGEGKRKDQVRDAWLRGEGIEVLRFGGFEVEEDTRQVLGRIDEMLMQRCAK